MRQAGLGGQKPCGGAQARPQSVAPARKLFGLVELDPAGTVLYHRFEPDGAAAVDATGRNFFTEVAPFKNVCEFRRRLEDFTRGSQPAQSMDFTCEYADGPLTVRVLLTRIRERTEAKAAKSLLVHIRRAE